MLAQLTVFFPLAVITNSLVPFPFEPVLLAFVTPVPFPEVWAFLLVGAVCTAIGEALSVRFLGSLPARIGHRTPGWLARTRHLFYVWAGLMAATPLPITMVRAAAYWRKPHPVWFGVSVGLGRLPRHLLLIAVWKGIVIPGLGLV